ncbi:TPA: hypothetical protein ACGW3N_000436 [Pseudomonas aeruginosa]|uniref:Uncharacterized protein n=1 Tax=Pseudomonas aeruginosa TaxID=287 RepID=A0A241XS81_PSEAI|nr:MULTISPECIES: hypothetical protein [Pseudomonas]ELG7182086.1 hypothetical protein [Pseudomonas aeruginosa]MBH4094943.1 hypothetical protein [Pseudomonas aeruginosa]MBI6603340.1 hypothetical protein [Pseudomonas sp. S4_EA_1b]MBI8852535.1 hypothetical protein [Pseudomonas aeruginosa]OBY57610.1 hypothetical protein A9513_003015 [Pseudomonas sp. AU12215]
MTQSSIEVHPDFPFIRVGLAYDFDTSLAGLPREEHVVDPGDWWMEVAGEVQGLVYGSRDRALADVEKVIFAEWRDNSFVEQQIAAAVDAGNTHLALRLAEGRGRARGRRDAKEEFAAALSEVDHVLKRFRSR